MSTKLEYSLYFNGMPMVNTRTVRDIQNLREKLGLNQEELADALGLAGKNVVSRWETGERKPSEALRRLFAIWLGLPVSESRRLLEKFRSYRR